MLMSAGRARSTASSRISRMICRAVLGSRLGGGLVDQQQVGILHESRPIPTRWRWPPESASARLS
jgi:hypothetical protein